MNYSQILNLYLKDQAILNTATQIKELSDAKFQIKALIGSLTAFVVGSLHRLSGQNSLIILPDREDALYLVNDLELLFPDQHVLLYPASSKRPYHIETIDNANVLQRAEVLSLYNQVAVGELLIVSYPEALYEKVIDRKSLVTNTLHLRKGDKLGMDFILEVLREYQYEKADFVTQPGQFAIRGGLMDIFTYSFEQPYRLDFFDDEIENIRIFDPNNQLTIKESKQLTIIPNINLHISDNQRISFIEYIAPQTRIYIKDIVQAGLELQKLYDKASLQYQKMYESSSGNTIQLKPEELFYRESDFYREMTASGVIELTNTPHFTPVHSLSFSTKSQPTFNKQFQLLTDHLLANKKEGLPTAICFENEKQRSRLQEIIHQLNPDVSFHSLLHTIHQGFIDTEKNIALYTDHQIFDRYHRYKVKSDSITGKGFTLRELLQLQPGDYVTHMTHGVGRFGGLEKIKVGENEQEAAKIIFSEDGVIYVNVNALHKISKFVSRDGTPPKLNKLGSGEWVKTKTKVKKRVKELAFDLVNLYAQRKALKGFTFSGDDYLQYELEASFMYEETPDQMKAIEDVKGDMENPAPMDRLVCGDVGFGKTEVAIRAAFKAAANGKQVVILVPTTILAMQHYNTFRDRYDKFPVTVEYINRLKSAKDQKETLQNLAEGKVDIIIGTHRLLSKDVQFKNLGLIIIDEEHKFGVGHKEKLKLLKTNVDTLTLTATPIPRTLQFSLLGIRDMSLITTPPPNRQPVETIITTFDLEKIRDAVSYELRRGGQVFFIHNRIKDLEEIGAMIKKVVPDARIGVAHGQMDAEAMESALVKFVEKETDVLVSTTIVESGLDIPNANTILINQAHSYGLSDLHQMRGRVGRSNRKAFCYLISPSLLLLSTDARKRLQALEQFSDLGSGFQIAMRDLDIRGAGDILGKEQSGFIADVGYETYQKILEEAIHELKQAEGLEIREDELNSQDVNIDIEENITIPDDYVPNVAERLNFYKRLSEAENEAELITISRELIDRFGVLPVSVFNLMDTIRLRTYAQKLGFEKVIVKNGTMRINFLSNTESDYYKSEKFQAVLNYVTDNPKKCSLNQVRSQLQLTIDKIKSVKDALFTAKDVFALIGSTIPVTS